MFCTNCGKQFGGNFCPQCGTPTCADNAPAGEDTTMFEHLIDKAGNVLDLAHVVGTYKNKSAIGGFFTRFTDYSPSEISKIVSYALSNVVPEKMNLMQAASAQTVLESAARGKSNAALKNERIRENKKNGVACCPKCGSTSLSANRQGAGIGKSAVGLWAVGALGAAAGALGSNKTHVTCLNCGNKWKL